MLILVVQSYLSPAEPRKDVKAAAIEVDLVGRGDVPAMTSFPAGLLDAAFDRRPFPAGASVEVTSLPDDFVARAVETSAVRSAAFLWACVFAGVGSGTLRGLTGFLFETTGDDDIRLAAPFVTKAVERLRGGCFSRLGGCAAEA